MSISSYTSPIPVFPLKQGGGKGMLLIEMCEEGVIMPSWSLFDHTANHAYKSGSSITKETIMLVTPGMVSYFISEEVYGILHGAYLIDASYIARLREMGNHKRIQLLEEKERSVEQIKIHFSRINILPDDDLNTKAYYALQEIFVCLLQCIIASKYDEETFLRKDQVLIDFRDAFSFFSSLFYTKAGGDPVTLLIDDLDLIELPGARYLLMQNAQLDQNNIDCLHLLLQEILKKLKEKGVIQPFQAINLKKISNFTETGYTKDLSSRKWPLPTLTEVVQLPK